MNRPHAFLTLLLGWFALVGPASAQVLPGDNPAWDAVGLRQAAERLAADPDAQVAGEALEHAVVLREFYAAREHQPLWMTTAWTNQRAALREEIAASAAHGFETDRYHLRLLERESELPDAELELLYADAYLSQSRHRANGVAGSTDGWFVQRYPVDAAASLTELSAGVDVGDTLRALWPQHSEYEALLEKRRDLARRERSADHPPVTSTLRAGDREPAVAMLKSRLLPAGDHTDVFDASLHDAVIEFQHANGLLADGVVGPMTRALVNQRWEDLVAQIDANLERWRWLPRDLPETYIRVNIAAFTLRVVDEGEDALRMDVIVGRSYRQTPVFTEHLRYMVIHPFWNVPRKLFVQDKLKLLREDPARMAAQGYEIQPPGMSEYLPVTAVDWFDPEPVRGMLRQRPGPYNALGTVKFMLPNAHAVYLHDTSERNLFSQQERALSSGCIRLSDPHALARWLLEWDNNPNAHAVDALFEDPSTKTIYLKESLPVYLVYFTAFVDDEDRVNFRRDIYQRDGRLIAALREDGTGLE